MSIAQYTTIYTPRGSAITVDLNASLALDPATEAIYDAWATLPNHSIVNRLNDSKYNCLGYAYGRVIDNNMHNYGYITSEVSPFDEDFFSGDGSFNKVPNFTDANFVIYYTTYHSINHLAVPDPTPNYPNNVTSKWFSYHLVWHPYDIENPYTENAIEFDAYAHDVYANAGSSEITRHTSIGTALSQVKTGQVVKIYGSYNLTTNHDFTNDIKLMSNSTLNVTGGRLKKFSGIILNPNSRGTITGTSYCRLVNSSSTIVGLYSSLSEALSDATSGETVVVYGSHLISSGATVPSGVTLQLTSGASISGSTLTVNGSLTSDAVTFSCPVVINGSANCQWSTFTGGIALNNTNNAIFGNCVINSSYYGVNSNNSYPSMNYCSITGTTYGVYNTNHSIGIIARTIFNNNYDAVKCDTVSYPICSPSNSFRTSEHFDIHSAGNGIIPATVNYWRNKTVTANVNSSNELPTDPYLKTSYQDEGEKTGILFKKSGASSNSEITGSRELFNKGMMLISEEKYDSAYEYFKTITEKYNETEESRNSLSFMEYILGKKEKGSDVLSLLNSYSSAKSNLSKYAEYRKNYYYFRLGEYDKALDIINNVSFTDKETNMEKVKLYDLGIIYYSCLEKKEEGLKYFNELVEKYPEDGLSEMAFYLYGANKPVKKDNKDIAENKKVDGTELLANYPNPFNPSTVIKYNIGENCMVSLKVYDVMGREVSTLVNEYKQKGAYDVKFNGAGLSSGIYFYQLKAGNVNQIQKMILTK